MSSFYQIQKTRIVVCQKELFFNRNKFVILSYLFPIQLEVKIFLFQRFYDNV